MRIGFGAIRAEASASSDRRAAPIANRRADASSPSAQEKERGFYFSFLSSYGSAADSMFFYFIRFGGGFDVLCSKILRTDS